MKKSSKAILLFGPLFAVGISLIILSQCERPVLDYLDEYKVLHYLHDQNTGKIIELGVLSNFGSTQYEVGVYETLKGDRSAYGLHRQQISIVGSPGPDPQEVQFDGKCYFVTSPFRDGWDKVNSVWRDHTSQKELCFYVLTPDGKRIDK